MAFVGMDGKLSRKENKRVLGVFWCFYGVSVA